MSQWPHTFKWKCEFNPYKMYFWLEDWPRFQGANNTQEDI